MVSIDVVFPEKLAKECEDQQSEESLGERIKDWLGWQTTFKAEENKWTDYDLSKYDTKWE